MLEPKPLAPTTPMSKLQIALLRSLADGEWHALDLEGHHPITIKGLVRRGFINYSAWGQTTIAIATDAGLKYLAALEPKP